MTEGDDGALTLAFAPDAAGLTELVQRTKAAAGTRITGLMTVTGNGTPHGTEYGCALERLAGTDAHFRLVCLD